MPKEFSREKGSARREGARPQADRRPDGRGRFERTPANGQGRPDGTHSDRPPEGKRPRPESAPQVDDELLLEGRNAVLEALKSGREVQRVYMARGVRGETINQIWELARANGVLVQEQERDDLDRRSATGHHQGVLATLAASPYASFEDVLNAAKAAGGTALVLVLDGIQDPENLGALVRTADAANVTGVIVPNRRSAGLTAVVAKAAAGALMYVPVARVSNLAQAVEQLKSVGLWIVAAEASGEKLYTDADLTGPLAVVIGGEGKGVGPNLMSRCDFTVKMPMHGHVNSLNASVAGGVLLYEVLRQRSTQNS